MQFKGFTLDPFQIDSIESINKNNSVVVSAATGTGKTLIADYVIDKFLQLGKKIIYTAPIKALSNQKYRDFKHDYGEEKVGILTGDVVINPEAPVLIMTTEIYRNMLVTKSTTVADVSYVVFDEIHYINDIERGTIWEESIIFSPEHVRFLCLSATIPNAREFADWIQDIKKHTVDVVKYDKRAVPLQHNIYDVFLGKTTVDELKENLKIRDYRDVIPHKKKQPREQHTQLPRYYHIDMINEVRQDLPCIFFLFNRRECEKKARELARKYDFTNKEQKERIIQYVNSKLVPETRRMQSVQHMKEVITKGIAYHHAGILPVLKEIVENLFNEGIIKVLYATETFAVGINMPARTVCFYSLEKYDGISFRHLNSKEYFQLAGRAGRRGIDKVGYVLAFVDRNKSELDKIKEFTSQDTEPIQSQFQLTNNTVLSLILNHAPHERETILKMNFDYYLRRKSNQQIRIMASFNNKYKFLEKYGYIKDDELTEKGYFAMHIFAYEMLITELFYSGVYHEFIVNELLILLTSVVYEPRRMDKFQTRNAQRVYITLIKKLQRRPYLFKNINKKIILRMAQFVTTWVEGGEFIDLLDLCNLQEGDIIRLFRRVIDVLRQIRRATSDIRMQEIVTQCLEKIDRDMVRVDF